MKNLFGINIVITLCLLITACGQVSQVTPTSSLSLEATPAPTVAPTSSPLPTFIVIPTQTNIPSKAPTLIPIVEPELVDGLLGKAFSVEELTNVYGYNIQQVTGWDYGFRHRCKSYQWLDSNHLMLFPSTGQSFGENYGIFDFTRPVIINLETGISWLPPYELQTRRECDLAPWSSKLGLLIFPDYLNDKDGVSTFTPDGEYINHYWGKLIGISPSGTKILIEDDSWTDLANGEVVDFAWYKETDEQGYFPQPIWSPDETRVFTCCYHFGDANSGKSFNFPYNHVTLNGEPYEDALYQSYGSWVRKDSLVLLQWDGFYGSNPGFIPLYNPAENTLRSLNQLAGISTESEFCQYSVASPNGMYAWVMCYDANYLVNFSNFETKSYPGYSQVNINWSADSKFAWIDNFDLGADSGIKILSVANGELKSLAVNPTFDTPTWWHPTDNVIVYVSESKQKLDLVNAETMLVQDLELPITFNNSLVWSPNREQIALTAEDGSLWQIDYPKLGNLEQLTQPMPDVRDVFWSPDGNSIAFVSGSDIYIVDTTK